MIGIVLGHQECRLHELDAEGLVGNDHRAAVRRMLVGEQPRRRVNGDGVCVTAVEMADDIGVKARHRFVEPDAEKRVND